MRTKTGSQGLVLNHLSLTEGQSGDKVDSIRSEKESINVNKLNVILHVIKVMMMMMRTRNYNYDNDSNYYYYCYYYYMIIIVLYYILGQLVSVKRLH